MIYNHSNYAFSINFTSFTRLLFFIRFEFFACIHCMNDIANIAEGYVCVPIGQLIEGRALQWQ